MRISGVASAMPEYVYPQDTLTGALKLFWGDKLKNPEQLDRLHSRTGVTSRHLAFPLERYPTFSSWGETNAAWFEVAQVHGERALDQALTKAGISRQDLHALFVVSITGIASPSLDARLINRMNLRSDIKRTPIFGVGCVGGALGLTRAADYTLAYPGHNAALLAVEVCSLTLKRDDLSAVNVIASGLFGDGAAAVIVSGSQTTNDQRPGAGPEILANGSFFYPGTEDIMGWGISETGFQIVLSPGLMDLVKANLSRDVDSFLNEHGLTRSDIGNWVIHTGGPRVLDAMQEALELEDRHLERSWDSLSRFGNLSSASVLLVLEDIAEKHRPDPGTFGVLLAMGPGFCSEMILLRW
ncbi:type III polyketide synthase [Beijerinckia indica]|uniref:3-Oxoacyl-(Acyl-carrier-protein (ACP)) synthase III domain protein n=1 Tax=Beijerinckia indica subsp. indica (strain ATCC 9039 / DSM 1715 / NCIMB 8712) TaxID=395963 RepID=B2IIY3_BEII9|nr:3-oxoacyl-[acyl-carrier-protein] synthase III C-terminal domain-containing protein [Beijerinckia indica]ACB96195.1 3-Oxoacyl-(acyl-carrier-protein (ACP)) synthase III domain protein [Beijerinckia indica subsp. indica ATCC 9039]